MGKWGNVCNVDCRTTEYYEVDMAGQEKKKMTLHTRPNPRSESGCWHLQSSLCHCYMGGYHNVPTFCPTPVFGSLGGTRTRGKHRTTEPGK